jgi:hypothetical protein
MKRTRTNRVYFNASWAALVGLCVTVVSGCAATTHASRAATSSSPASVASVPGSPQPVASNPVSTKFPKLPNYTPPNITAPPRVSGIFTTHESPLTQAEYKVNNAWQGPGSKPGQWLVVYAGESMTDRVPALAIYSLPTDPNSPDQDPSLVGLYRDAKATGALQITAASGEDLTIGALTANGSVVPQTTFSVATGAFATS